MTPAEQVASKKRRRLPRRRTQSVNRVLVCRIPEERTKLGLSLLDIKNATKLCVANLWRVEQGGDVQLTTARKLCRFFGMTIDQLWPTESAK